MSKVRPLRPKIHGATPGWGCPATTKINRKDFGLTWNAVLKRAEFSSATRSPSRSMSSLLRLEGSPRQHQPAARPRRRIQCRFVRSNRSFKQAHHRGRRSEAATRLRLRQDERFRSVSAARRFPQRQSRGLSGWLSVASAPRDRDDYLCTGGSVEHGDSLGIAAR